MVGDQIRFVASVDQPIRESMIEPLHRDVDCMWNCSILLLPLHISIHTATYSKCLLELVLHINETLLCDSDCLLVRVFYPNSPIISCFEMSTQFVYFRVQEPMNHFVWGFCALVHTVIAINISAEPESGFIAEPNIKEVRILFNLVLEPPAYHKMFFPSQLV